MPIASLTLLILTACASVPIEPEPVPCPIFPTFQTIEGDTTSFILSVLNDDAADPVLSSALHDILDTVAQNNITWNEYARKLEVRAECSD